MSMSVESGDESYMYSEAGYVSSEYIGGDISRESGDVTVYQDAFLQIAQKTDGNLSRNPSAEVGKLAKIADEKFKHEGSWTPSEKTRAMVISGVVISTIVNIGVVFAALQSGLTTTTLLAIPATVIMAAGIYYLCNRVDLDRSSDRARVQADYAQRKLAEIVNSQQVATVVGYDLLAACKPAGMSAEEFYGRFSCLAEATILVNNQNEAICRAINEKYNILEQPWKSLRDMATMELARRRNETYHERRRRELEPRENERGFKDNALDLLKTGVNLAADVILQKQISECNDKINEIEKARQLHLKQPERVYNQAMQILQNQFDSLKAGERNLSVHKAMAMGYKRGHVVPPPPPLRPVHVAPRGYPNLPPPSYAESMSPSAPAF